MINTDLQLIDGDKLKYALIRVSDNIPIDVYRQLITYLVASIDQEVDGQRIKFAHDCGIVITDEDIQSVPPPPKINNVVTIAFRDKLTPRG